jgi:hypothetical protein
MTKRALSLRYDISLSSVKRLLRLKEPDAKVTALPLHPLTGGPNESGGGDTPPSAVKRIY